MSSPGPDERLRERLAHLPDACRALLAALDRQASRGGGEVPARFIVGTDGEIERVEIAAVYERTVSRPTCST